MVIIFFLIGIAPFFIFECYNEQAVIRHSRYNIDNAKAAQNLTVLECFPPVINANSILYEET